MEYLSFDEPIAENLEKFEIKIPKGFYALEILLGEIEHISLFRVNRLSFFSPKRETPFCPIGFVGYGIEDSEMFISIMKILEENQGKGIGREVVKYFIEKENPRRVELDADESSEGFWIKMGFKLNPGEEIKDGYRRFSLRRGQKFH